MEARDKLRETIEALSDAEARAALAYIRQRLVEVDSGRDQPDSHEGPGADGEPANNEASHALVDTAEERAARAGQRDAAGLRRDQAAGVRDDSAEVRVKGGSGISERTHAAHRVYALSDRQAAARDREHAAQDREAAGTDDLTGARRRDDGLAQLQREIDRVRRASGRLVVAYVDVDGLKAVNDSQGHDAGDRLLIGLPISSPRSCAPTT